MKCPFDTTPLRYERDKIPVLPAELYPQIIEDDSLVERLNAIREKYPFVKFEGNPAIHFLGWNELGEIYRNWPIFSSDTMKVGYKTGETPMIPAGYDPPQAQVYKAYLQRKFTEADAKTLEPLVRARAAELIDQLLARGECEYMEDFAGRYFGPILLANVGIPSADIDMVQQLEVDTFRTDYDDPDGSIRERANHGLSSYLVDLVKQCRANLPPPDERGDDLITYMLTEPMSDGRLMDDSEVKSALHILCLGGAHSVKAGIGYAMKILADRPDLRDQLFHDGEIPLTIVDELLRWNGVGGGMNFRTVAQASELAGCPLEPGDTICTVMTAANHDPRASDDADELRFDRKSVKSFTFSFATHRCLGIHFAKMGTKVALEEWHKRIPNYQVKDAGPLKEQIWAGVGYLALPLEWSAA